jgi:predicted TIM-barrel fold metal-dependent hydrolase
VIIDCHCHAGTGDGFTGPWDTRAALPRYLQRAREAGIDRTVVFAPFTSDYATANEEVCSIVARHPARLSAFAFVHPARDAGRVHAMVSAAVEDCGFVGIKVHRHDAPITREICETARALRVPVLYDVMGEVAPVELLADEYPDVAFVIPHLGSFADDWKAQRALIDVLSRLPNVHTDTAGVRRFDLLEEAVQRAGAGKVLFGSDGPWLHPGVELAKIRALKLAPRDEQLVVGGNWLRLTEAARARARRSAPPREGVTGRGAARPAASAARDR